jgi:hypothetical protein
MDPDSDPDPAIFVSDLKDGTKRAGDIEVSGSATAKSYGSGSATLPVGSSWRCFNYLPFLVLPSKSGQSILGCKILN